jgi:hypothetical protein
VPGLVALVSIGAPLVVAYAERLHVDEARLAAAAGVVMESLGLTAGEAFEWITEESGLTGIPVLEVADLVVRDETWDVMYPGRPGRPRARRRRPRRAGDGRLRAVGAVSGSSTPAE